MNFRPVSKEDLDINLTPLIDVVFLLLIFFMVSTTFVKQSEIELTLPEASEELRTDPVDKIEIAISKKGEIFINGQALVNSQLETIKKGLVDNNTEVDGEPVVIINADEQARHQLVIDVMDAARQVGLFKVTFPTRLRD
ncbi:MAG: biopolymer transporter ExbD [Pseudomonadota bacterium]